MPVIDHHSFQSRIELFSLLKPILKASYWAIYNAYEAALSSYKEGRANIINIYEREMPGSKDFRVVLLGRPYSVLQSTMNKGILDIFSNLTIKTFYQDMLPADKGDLSETGIIQREF
jgi:predicted nucleotide-binding protein (sugar kinase/HSP70/actin superfamily)